MPLAASSGYSPRGIFQAYSPVFKLIAFKVPQGGAMAGYPSISRNLLNPVNRYCESQGTGFASAGTGTLDSNPSLTYEMIAAIWLECNAGNPGMRPLPLTMVDRSSATLKRLPISTSEGIAGGAPVRPSPWHAAHCVP